MEIKYQCSNCQYKFSPRNPHKVPTVCPYCNVQDTLDRIKSAQDLVDEAVGL